MLRFAKIVNENTKEVQIVQGEKLISLLGAVKLDVEQAYNGSWFLKGHAPEKPQIPLEQTLIQLEQKYNMPRVIREGILSNPAAYSEFNVNRAKDLEAIAEKIRSLKEGK